MTAHREGEHREITDKRISKQFNRRVIIPLLLDLGARYLRQPYMGAYNDTDKTSPLGTRPQGRRRQAAPEQSELHRHSLSRMEIVTRGRQRRSSQISASCGRESTTTDWRRMTRRTAPRR